MIIDRDGEELINIPVDEIKGEKTMSDGSTRFKFIGGPYHDMVFRVYAPFDVVTFPNGVTYELNPPLNLKKSSKWVYVYDAPTSREKGYEY